MHWHTSSRPDFTGSQAFQKNSDSELPMRSCVVHNVVPAADARLSPLKDADAEAQLLSGPMMRVCPIVKIFPVMMACKGTAVCHASIGRARSTELHLKSSVLMISPDATCRSCDGGARVNV
eukprot:6208165-Pleurochrysis_carterae.AAC.4